MHKPAVVTASTPALANFADQMALKMSRHWFAVFTVVFGLWILAPFLAPILMYAGLTGPAGLIYKFYSFFCHQLPQRSLFLFGPQRMYSLADILAAGPINNLTSLRQFVGSPALGYKVAWSDRMIALYGGLWLGTLIFALAQKWLKGLSPALWVAVGVLPLLLDGGSHLVNDILSGMSGAGFRDTNAWLQFLTGNRLPPEFYRGDALGSFNSDARWVTGLLFGLTTAWFLFPILAESIADLRANLETKLRATR